MRWQGRRQSTNIEDRRGMRISRGGLVGGGIGTIAVALLVIFLGGDPTAVLQQAGVVAECATVTYPGDGETAARQALDRCIGGYVERVTGDLADRAARDPLTGLLNHEAFHGRLSVEVARARRYRGRLALVLFDLDRFKETNDRDGHPEGDRLLRAFATALEGTARLSDVLGRLGGDEFGALLLEVEPGRVASFLARLRARLPEGPAASAGAAFLPDEGSTAEQLVGLADRRLYEDKARAA